jgi:hypothetical protein
MQLERGLTAAGTPSVKAWLSIIGATIVVPAPRSPKQLEKLVEREVDKRGSAIKSIGLSTPTSVLGSSTDLLWLLT